MIIECGKHLKRFSKGKKDRVTGPQDKHRSIMTILHMVNRTEGGE